MCIVLASRGRTQMKARIINYTPVPDSVLKEYIRYCMPTGLSLKDVSVIKFDNSTLHFHGRAWPLDMRTTIGVPSKYKYRRPFKTGGFRGYLPNTVYTWDEHLIELIAHELRHLWQYKYDFKVGRETKKIRKYNMGTRAKLCEVDASLYAKRVVRGYRKGTKLHG